MPIEDKVKGWITKSDSGDALIVNVGSLAFVANKQSFLRMLKGKIDACPMSLLVPEDEEESDETDEEIADELGEVEELGEMDSEEEADEEISE